MSLNQTSARVRPYAGRDEAFAAAMARAEEAAEPKPKEPDYIGRTRSGLVQRANGTLFRPGPLFDRAVFDDLSLLD